MPKENELVLFFKNIAKDDIPLVGGKGANLGEMTRAGFPVPPGFAVTVSSYNLFLIKNNLSQKISDILKGLNVENSKDLDTAAKKVQKLILRSEIPQEVSIPTIKAYKKISGIFKNTHVAVRSSATAEDLPEASFAGEQESYLNVKGEANLLLKIRECWASLFTARAIYYRVQNKIDHNKVKISVMVQKMIQSEVSGVMFTINPVTNEKDRIIVEAVWGLGEMIVQGSVVPDHYVVQKDTFSILSKEVSDQKVQLIKEGNLTRQIAVPTTKINLQKLSDKEVVTIAKIGQKLQEHYFHPQDVEWAKDSNNNIFIVQTRPVTTTQKKFSLTKTDLGLTLPEQPILTGSPACPGIGTGHVKILKSAKEIGKIKEGDVLVSKMTSPDFVPAMKKASAIITDEGGQTSHAAIVSRELGIPCVVGTKEATKLLKEGYVVTVDGARGHVYLGSKIKLTTTRDQVDLNKKYAHTKTATKVYVNLAEPERAPEISRLNVQGVGLLRAEFMIANIGIHPKEAIRQKTQNEFIDKLAKDLTIFCKSFYPRPVVYRATDFKTNEYRALIGGKAWEPIEPNPLMGFRGAFRYTSSPEVFNLELQAIKKVREKYDNLWLMVPFVRSPEELRKVRRIVAAEGLFESTNFKFWMMVELPVNVILIDEFLEVGVDGISIGSNDLAMLTLGTDRDNAEVREAYNERSEAVLWSLRRVIKSCHKHGVTSSICGQAPSTYDDLVRKLVKYGITSMSVNPDAVGRVRGVIAEVEQDLIK